MPLTSADQQTISQVVDLLRPNLRLLFLTGAGLSADSGLPTYRGHDGIYQSDRLTRHGIPIEQALSESMLVARPDITWEFLVELERVTRRATFNRGHQVIAEMESHFREVWTLTQNIDGLHRAAGARNVIDIHGDLHELRCNRCTYRVTVRDYEHLTLPPRCPLCSDFVRPDVVLYGEEGRIVQTLTQRVGRTTTAHIDLDLFGAARGHDPPPYVVSRPRGRLLPLAESAPGASATLDLDRCSWRTRGNRLESTHRGTPRLSWSSQRWLPLGGMDALVGVDAMDTPAQVLVRGPLGALRVQDDRAYAPNHGLRNER